MIPDHEILRNPPPLHRGVQWCEDELGNEEPEESADAPYYAAPDHLGGGMVLEVDPAVGHNGARPQTQQHAQRLPGNCVSQTEQGK